MTKVQPHPRSLFAQRLDRIAFVTYFLGAVVPLSALAVQVHRHHLGAWPWVALIASIGALSLGAFLALRRTVHAAIGRMDRDNAHLLALLSASGELSGAQDAVGAAEVISRRACRLAGALMTVVVRGTQDEAGLEVAACTGIEEDEVQALLEGDLLREVEGVVGRPDDEDPARTDELPGRKLRAGQASLVLPMPVAQDSRWALVTVCDSGLDEAEQHALATLAGLGTVAIANSDGRHAQRNFFAHVVELLSTALDAHLGYLGGHGHRVAAIADRIAHELAVGAVESQDLHFAALLHDIGLLRIDRDRHDDAPSCRMHPRYGYEMLSRIRLWERSAPLVLHHHEWWNGGGYPDGLSGESIPMGSRIIAVADAFDAMTSPNSYGQRVGPEEAVQELRRSVGTQFDPQVVAAFQRLLEEGEIEVAEELAPAAVS